MRQIQLTKPWGELAAGTTLAVWAPGEALGPDVVDPQRAAQLEADGFAVDPDAVPAAPRTKKKGGEG